MDVGCKEKKQTRRLQDGIKANKVTMVRSSNEDLPKRRTLEALMSEARVDYTQKWRLTWATKKARWPWAARDAGQLVRAC